MRIAVRHAEASEGPPAVDRAPGGKIHDVHRVRVVRIRPNDGVVPGPHHPFLIAARALPGFPAVVRTEDSTGRVLR